MSFSKCENRMRDAGMMVSMKMNLTAFGVLIVILYMNKVFSSG
jgi:hypothetical protein